MLVFSQKTQKAKPDLTLELGFDERTKSRIIATSEGQEVMVLLPRGEHLHDGDVLISEEQQLLQISFKPEALCQVVSEEPHKLAQVAYHLGNRHVALEIQKNLVRFQPDHVLEEMLQQLGFAVSHIESVFYPEAGAYGDGKYFSQDGHRH